MLVVHMRRHTGEKPHRCTVRKVSIWPFVHHMRVKLLGTITRSEADTIEFDRMLVFYYFLLRIIDVFSVTNRSQATVL